MGIFLFHLPCKFPTDAMLLNHLAQFILILEFLAYVLHDLLEIRLEKNVFIFFLLDFLINCEFFA